MGFPQRIGDMAEPEHFRDIEATVVAPRTHTSANITGMAGNCAFQPCPKAADSGIKGQRSGDLATRSILLGLEST
jgi:hypothetical protein